MKASILIWASLCLLLNITFAQSPTGEVVIGQRTEMKSEFTDYNYKISVYLPPQYGKEKENPNQRYSVLYLFIGRDHLFHAATGMAGLLDRYAEVPDMIVVGITNISWWADLTPEPVEGREGTGGAPKFHQFVSEQLIPYVDQTYRTNDHRLFMGHSLGGMYGIYTLTENADLFEDYVLLSPSIENRANSLYPKLNALMESDKKLTNNIYMIVGSEGDRMDRGMAKLSKAFAKCKDSQFSWTLDRQDELDHFTIILPGILNGLKFVAKDDLKD